MTNKPIVLDFPTILKGVNEHTKNLNKLPPRTYLGLSGIGDECIRKIFWRWRFASYEAFPPRLYRLFSRGHEEEPRFVDLFRGMGMITYPNNPATGRQFEVVMHNGHVKGHTDGMGQLIGTYIINGKTYTDPWLLLEMKTASNKSFMKFSRAKNLAISNFTYYAQTQVYMKGFNLKNCLWVVVNKDNDNIYGEIIEYDHECFRAMDERCVDLCQTTTIPGGCSQDSNYYKCGYCWFRDLCFEGAKPNENCRLCQSVRLEDKGKWSCSKNIHKSPTLTIGQQRAGCKKFRIMEGL